MGRWVLKSKKGLGGGWAVGEKVIAGPYRQSRSVGLKGSEIPGGMRESMPVMPLLAAETGGSCGSWMFGSSFITRAGGYVAPADPLPTSLLATVRAVLQ